MHLGTCGRVFETRELRYTRSSDNSCNLLNIDYMQGTKYLKQIILLSPHNGLSNYLSCTPACCVTLGVGLSCIGFRACTWPSTESGIPWPVSRTWSRCSVRHIPDLSVFQFMMVFHVSTWLGFWLTSYLALKHQKLSFWNQEQGEDVFFHQCREVFARVIGKKKK